MVYFVSGIDTDAGKSVVTGLLARSLRKRGVNVYTDRVGRNIGGYSEAPGDYGD